MTTKHPLLRLPAAAQLASQKTSTTVSPLKMWRWANYGRHGVTLGTIDVAGHQLTDEKMLDRFLLESGLTGEASK